MSLQCHINVAIEGLTLYQKLVYTDSECHHVGFSIYFCFVFLSVPLVLFNNNIIKKRAVRSGQG